MNDIVKILNGVVFAESQEVAPRFNKKHKDVLRRIDSLIRDLTAHRIAVKNFFVEGEFINSRNRVYRNYLMTRDGFSMLAMSLDGKESMKFKVQFIEAFNKMESELKRQSVLRLSGIETRKTMTDKIKDTGENERMHGHGYSNYTKMAYKMIGIEYKKPEYGRFRDSLSPDDLERLETVEGMTKELLKAGKQYGEVKQIINDIFGDGQKKLKG